MKTSKTICCFCGGSTVNRDFRCQCKGSCSCAWSRCFREPIRLGHDHPDYVENLTVALYEYPSAMPRGMAHVVAQIVAECQRKNAQSGDMIYRSAFPYLAQIAGLFAVGMHRIFTA